ncbi:MAG: ASKHA domain-containing protein [Bryobacteraceae bacterium]
MSGRVRIELHPLGKTIHVERGAPLHDVLFPYGVEFPCGGRGRCARCRVRLLEGTLDPTPEEVRILGAAEIAAGWRLACHTHAAGDLTLEIAQWETAILADSSAFEFTPKEGLGIAVDVGTTTLVAQLLDLRTAHVLGVRTALNPQVKHGSDVMSRVEFALGGGQYELTALIRGEIGTLIRKLAPREPVRDVVLVGNTVMHHLFCGISVEPLSHTPFEPVRDGLETLAASELGWSIPGDPPARFLPSLGGFVGSDILAGVLATRMHERGGLTALLDLGTNGEIIVGNRERMVCASTAAGPAFEGGRISCGMRAATGAISEVTLREGRLECRVLGHGAPRGICGSGLVDAVACALEVGLIAPSGRLRGSKTLPLAGPVALTQADIRELQLAKGATAAGMEIVLERWGARPQDLERVYLAGAFGNYLNRAGARRIGLLNFPLDTVEPAGNTALLGAKLALFDGAFAHIRQITEHVPLGSDPEFQEKYVSAMPFPDRM